MAYYNTGIGSMKVGIKMETALTSAKDHNFVKKNFIYIIILSVLFMFGMENKIVLFACLFILIFAIAFSSNENRFCWSLFLVPNIRIFDNFGSTSLVNFLICLPFFFYIIKRLLIDRGKITDPPIIMAVFLFVIEYIHMLFLDGAIAPVIGWALGFAWSCYATSDENVNVNKNDAIYALSLGIICSAAIYLVNNPWFSSDIINYVKAGDRFEAYADDPNYYSLYICLSLAGIVIKRNLKAIDLALMVVLMCIGFMTASKMCFLLMTVNVIYLVTATNDTLNKYIRNMFILIFGCCIVFALRGYIGQFIENLFRRTGGESMDLNTLTTGRYDILVEYMEVLKKDIFTMMFGKGFAYDQHLSTVSMHISHNTFLDFILSWGISGCIVLIFVFWYWVEIYKKKLCTYKFAGRSKYPTIVLLFSFCALSCFNAGMFFFVIAFCMLQLEPKNEGEKQYNG